MRANRSPPLLFNLALSFCTALLIFAMIRSLNHETPPSPPPVADEPTKPILIFEGKAAEIPENIEELPPPLKKHVVQDRESLSSISKKYYGTEAHWEKIWHANENVIPNHHKIKPGITLIIP